MITDVNLSEFMGTDEITNAWEEAQSDIAMVVSTLQEAVNNRLRKLKYNEARYKDGSNSEIERLLTIRDELDSLDGLF